MALVRAFFPQIREILDMRLKHLICNKLKKEPAGKNTEDFINALKTAF